MISVHAVAARNTRSVMGNRVIIVHGWGGTPETNWFPALKIELEKTGVGVLVPAMPNTEKPLMTEWLDELKRVVGQTDKQTYFVGHSLGCITILRYLELLNNAEKVGGAVLVAGFSESVGIPEIESFFTTPLDYEKVKARTDKIIAINSENDPYVPMKFAEILRDKLAVELNILDDAGHINQPDGYPIIFSKISDLLR